MQSIIILTLVHSRIQYINSFVIHPFTINVYNHYKTKPTTVSYWGGSICILQWSNGLALFVKNKFTYSSLSLTEEYLTAFLTFIIILVQESGDHVLSKSRSCLGKDPFNCSLNKRTIDLLIIIINIIILCKKMYSNIITDSPHLLTHKQWIDRPYCNWSLRGELSER